MAHSKRLPLHTHTDTGHRHFNKALKYVNIVSGQGQRLCDVRRQERSQRPRFSVRKPRAHVRDCALRAYVVNWLR